MNTQHHTPVGAKISSLRQAKNLTIEEVAQRSGLSAQQVTSIETDAYLPSLGSLIKVARALGVRLGTFLDDTDELGPAITRAADRQEAISFSNDSAEARRGMDYHALARQKAGRHMEPFIIDIRPDEKQEYQLSAHEGEEFIYVLDGEIEVAYGANSYRLAAGDSIFYDSIVNHHVHGADGKKARILAVVYIPI